MPELFLEHIRHGGLVPATDEDVEKIAKLPLDHVFKMKFVLKHNYKFHKKVFEFLTQAFELQEHFEEFSEFRKWIIAKAGYYKVIECPNGFKMYESASLDYDSMEDIDKDKCFKAMVKEFLDWRSDALTREDYDRIFNFGD